MRRHLQRGNIMAFALAGLFVAGIGVTIVSEQITDRIQQSRNAQYEAKAKQDLQALVMILARGAKAETSTATALDGKPIDNYAEIKITGLSSGGRIPATIYAGVDPWGNGYTAYFQTLGSFFDDDANASVDRVDDVVALAVFSPGANGRIDTPNIGTAWSNAAVVKPSGDDMWVRVTFGQLQAIASTARKIETTTNDANACRNGERLSYNPTTRTFLCLPTVTQLQHGSSSVGQSIIDYNSGVESGSGRAGDVILHSIEAKSPLTLSDGGNTIDVRLNPCANDGETLVMGSNNSWVCGVPNPSLQTIPACSSNGQILAIMRDANGNVAFACEDDLGTAPSGSCTGADQVLSWNGSNWVCSNYAPGGQFVCGTPADATYASNTNAAYNTDFARADKPNNGFLPQIPFERVEWQRKRYAYYDGNTWVCRRNQNDGIQAAVVRKEFTNNEFGYRSALSSVAQGLSAPQRNSCYTVTGVSPLGGAAWEALAMCNKGDVLVACHAVPAGNPAATTGNIAIALPPAYSDMLNGGSKENEQIYYAAPVLGAADSVIGCQAVATRPNANPPHPHIPGYAVAICCNGM